MIKTELHIVTKTALLFPEYELIEPSKLLVETLERNAFFYFYSEKARSEGIVINILAEICLKNKGKVSLYSGAVLTADTEKGLNGECDFILGMGEQTYNLEVPLFCLIEAEDNDIEKNIPQCIAQMEGARVYNEQEGKPLTRLYGCVTTGESWQFLMLENQICYLDTQRFFLSQLPHILGVLQTIIHYSKNIS